MRCVNCGMPLSPSRKNCPRCGTASVGKQASDQGAGATFNQPGGFFTDRTQVGMNPPQQQWNPAAPWQGGTYGQPTAQPVAPPVMQPMQPQAGPYNTPPMVPNSPANMQPWSQVPQMPFNTGNQPFPQPPFNTGNQPFSQPPINTGNRPFPQPPTNRRSMRFGFTAAGLCILAGGLILAFVYFMSLSLSGPSNTAQVNQGTTNNSATATPATAAAMPSATASVAATPQASPTATFPGQQYIDHAQMSSAINQSTAQPTTLTTTFQPKQQIFVTFSVHPNGHNGAACLIWYLNSQQISHYEIALDPTPENVYSYANINGSGPAYVEIYWASSTQCTDKMLAQHVDFTISG